ncbi:MAG TPA: cardiolipin synthase ClsB [Caldimonas sp.]|jgi:cardiolipin synthase|nr:cardiolipin synthase ClsB [Caldimonas sp.]HEV7576411.1 cardiolipin synthase ClsB [Caldimonas sp.]
MSSTPRSRRAEATRALQPGHRLQLLKGGAAMFDALVAAIDGARAEVMVETYIFEFSGAPLGVAEALERAAARGVTVRVVVDGIGTDEIPVEWCRRWQAAGVRWRVFNPARGWRVLLPARWRRLHRKLCVVDATICFCGGINLIDDYVDPTHGRLEQPRFDFSVRVTGPLVADAHETMTRLWLRQQVVREARQIDFKAALAAVRRAARAGTDADDSDLTAGDLSASPGPAAPGLLAGLVLRDNFRFRKRIEHFYRYAIAQAKREIVIANAYFVPGVALQRALLRAAKRGVKITLLLQGRYEYFMQHHASRAMYGVMLDAGIEIIEYAPSFLHAKVAVFDGGAGGLATVGSSNLDPLSLLLAREANVFVRDDRFGAELRGHLLDAVRNGGKRVEKSAHVQRPFVHRSLAWIAYGAMRFALFATRHRY